MTEIALNKPTPKDPKKDSLWTLFMDFVRSSIQSKKFMAFIAGVVANIAAMLSIKFGIPEEVAEAATLKISGLVGSYVVGQGIADAGKEKAKVQAAAAMLKEEKNSKV